MKTSSRINTLFEKVTKEAAPTTRKFGGKDYKFVTEVDFENQAHKKALEIEQRGGDAEIVKSGAKWAVYQLQSEKVQKLFERVMKEKVSSEEAKKRWDTASNHERNALLKRIGGFATVDATATLPWDRLTGNAQRVIADTLKPGTQYLEHNIKVGDKVHSPSGYAKVIKVDGNKITVRSNDPAGDFEYDVKQVQKEKLVRKEAWDPDQFPKDVWNKAQDMTREKGDEYLTDYANKHGLKQKQAIKKGDLQGRPDKSRVLQDVKSRIKKGMEPAKALEDTLDKLQVPERGKDYYRKSIMAQIDVKESLKKEATDKYTCRDCSFSTSDMKKATEHEDKTDHDVQMMREAFSDKGDALTHAKKLKGQGKSLADIEKVIAGDLKNPDDVDWVMTRLEKVTINKLYEKVVRSKGFKELSQDAIKRMDGLTAASDMDHIMRGVRNIRNDLSKDGFSNREIREWIDLLINKVI